jgi:hypothetical protein
MPLEMNNKKEEYSLLMLALDVLQYLVQTYRAAPVLCKENKQHETFFVQA